MGSLDVVGWAFEGGRGVVDDVGRVGDVAGTVGWELEDVVHVGRRGRRARRRGHVRTPLDITRVVYVVGRPLDVVARCRWTCEDVVHRRRCLLDVVGHHGRRARASWMSLNLADVVGRTVVPCDVVDVVGHRWALFEASMRRSGLFQCASVFVEMAWWGCQFRMFEPANGVVLDGG